MYSYVFSQLKKAQIPSSDLVIKDDVRNELYEKVTLTQQRDKCAFLRIEKYYEGSLDFHEMDSFPACIYVSIFRLDYECEDIEVIFLVTIGNWKIQEQDGSLTSAKLTIVSQLVLTTILKLVNPSSIHETERKVHLPGIDSSFCKTPNRDARGALFRHGRWETISSFFRNPLILYHD